MKRFLPYPTALAIFLLGGCGPDLPSSPLEAPDAALAAVEAAQTLSPQPTGQYIVVARGQGLPNRFAESIEAAGGTVVQAWPEIGVAVVEGGDRDFESRASRISGIASVTPDMIIPWIEQDHLLQGPSVEAAAVAGGVTAENIGDGAFFRAVQWHPESVQARDAWLMGYTGAGVRVAVLDGGLHAAHLDLAASVDVAASASFVPGLAFNQDTGTFWHGTHVAGIVGARGDIGAVGMAPRSTLIGVKVLHSGSGAFGWILGGIMYAATPQSQGGAGAQVINMSLGATIDYRNNWGDKDFRDAFRELTTAFDRATRYAYQQGVTVIASAGNGATNFDDAKELYKIPAHNQHVISVSATGPIGWALTGATNFERPAYYTDHGKSLVDLAAPGGSAGLLVEQGFGGNCTVGPSTVPCYAFDMVFNTSRGSAASVTTYTWSQGTSMAAPAVAGIAALIIEANGGQMHPSQVRTRLMQSAADLGEPGNDAFYGHGWVNAYRAVGGR